MPMPDSLRYLIEALRTQPADASTVPQTGPRAGQNVAPQNNLGPIEQRRDGYRMYVQEKNTSGESPVSYEEWMKTQE